MALDNFSVLWNHKPFMRFWCARLFGVSANQMMLVVLSWQMYELTGSAWELGLVGLCQFLPALLLTIPAGYVIDHHHRARIFAYCLLVQLFIVGTLLISTHFGWINHLIILILSVLLGAVRAFQMPAQQAITPVLVPPHLLSKATAFSTTGMQSATIGAPAIGGLLYGLGADVVYGVCLILLLYGSLLAFGVRYQHQVRATALSWFSALDGFRFIWNNKTVLGAVTLDLFAVLFGGAVALLPIFAKEILHVGPWGVGFLRAAPALGAVMMSIALTYWPLKRQAGKKLIYAVVVYGLATIVFGVSTSFILSFIALTISGAADSVSVIIRLSLVQFETPDDMRGRVSAVNSIFIGASNQLGEFESGLSAVVLGPVGSVLLGGIGTLLIAMSWMKIFPSLIQRDALQKPS